MECPYCGHKQRRFYNHTHGLVSANNGYWVHCDECKKEFFIATRYQEKAFLFEEAHSDKVREWVEADE